jgi:phage FluMu protein Com
MESGMNPTVDTAAIAHRARRRLFKFFGTPQTLGRCYDCGKPLTYQECRYYHTACERCEGINHERLDAALARDEEKSVRSWLSLSDVVQLLQRIASAIRGGGRT